MQQQQKKRICYFLISTKTPWLVLLRTELLAEIYPTKPLSFIYPTPRLEFGLKESSKKSLGQT